MSINDKEPDYLEEGDAYEKGPKTVLGRSVHPATLLSYEEAGTQVPDTPRLAVHRVHEQMIENVTNIKKSAPEIWFKLNKIYRIKD